jgi:alpha/beta superfamily hydrolase
VERLTLVTADGRALAADVHVPETEPMAAVVVSHPHPLYGGDRHHPVVTAVFDGLADVGCAVLRFDFRREQGDGVAERADVLAAIDALTERAPGVPVHLAGYSFGAAVSLAVQDPRIRSVVAIAPPLVMMPVPVPAVPVLVLVPEHDQFAPPAAVAPLVAAWPEVEIRTVPMGDHFLAGRAGWVADQAVGWLTATRPPTTSRT